MQSCDTADCPSSFHSDATAPKPEAKADNCATRQVKRAILAIAPSFNFYGRTMQPNRNESEG